MPDEGGVGVVNSRGRGGLRGLRGANYRGASFRGVGFRGGRGTFGLRGNLFHSMLEPVLELCA